MTEEFAGTTAKLTDADIATAAVALGTTPAHILAVCDVETGPQGAFDGQGRPTILYERHVFHNLTGGRFSGAEPDLSAQTSGGYGKYNQQYPKLKRAIRLSRSAALQACSWGKFQILGRNHRMCGHEDVESFVLAMMDGEKAHLAAFAAFINAAGLTGILRRGDWAAFARRYNGSDYKRNRYDEKLAAAFARHAGKFGA